MFPVYLEHKLDAEATATALTERQTSLRRIVQDNKASPFVKIRAQEELSAVDRALEAVSKAIVEDRS